MSSLFSPGFVYSRDVRSLRAALTVEPTESMTVETAEAISTWVAVILIQARTPLSVYRLFEFQWQSKPNVPYT